MDPEAYKFPAKRRDALERIDFEVLPLIIAAFFGHAYEHQKAYLTDLDAKLATGEISPERYNEAIEAASLEKLDRALRETFALWSKVDAVKPYDLTQAVENARRKTFDRHGRLKESPLIPIYRVMLSNWIIVENMSGPKELANFLTPQLKGKSKSATGELARIATLCSRLGVKFRGKSRPLELRRRHKSP